MLAVLGIPAIDRCNGDARDLLECLRGQVDDKFDLGLEPPSPAATASVAAVEPAVAELPIVEAAETLPVRPSVEASRSLVPQLKSAPPGATQPQVVAAPGVALAPDLPAEAFPVANLPAPEVSDAKPLETAALAAVTEPVAPSFVPPAPLVAVDGIPPDLSAEATEKIAPEPETPAPSFVPSEPALAAPEGVPPDLQIARDAAGLLPVDEPAPDFALPATLPLPTSAPPDLTVAAVEPEAVAPSFIPPAPPLSVEGVPPDLNVAAVDPVARPETPPPAVPVLAPSIDAVEIDGEGNFIAGNGPAGATMRLYVDGIPVGVSAVEGGRWLVEGTDLLTEGQQTLKVEAIDPLTGKVLGDSTIVFEGPSAPEPQQPAAAIPPPDAPPDGVSSAADPVEEPSQPEAIAEPPPVPPLAPVVPAGESTSVTIIGPSGAAAITTLATGNSSAEAIVTLGATPKSPAIMARFALPDPEPAADVTVLHAIPIGDPGAGRFVSGKAIIRRGDTLWDIAHRYYGSGLRYRTILRANTGLIASPGRIYPGQVFELPLVYDD